ncbi:hypothetical protein FPV67DRAFT_1431887 [Lyophyllum atratum]|nr:hypothetical protein FPV67DRAFT_1431887 [Lyophyllum atratum]
MPLTSEDERVFAVFVGRPSNDPTYRESCQRAYNVIMREGAQAKFSKSETTHRRGDFPALNVGVTMGLGATYPTNLDNGPHAAMVERLISNPDIQRLAHFADFAFSLWAPKVYAHYINHIGGLFEKLTYLRRIFPKSIFPAAAFNFGPKVWTRSHRDLLNFPIGWCAIQALGCFDPTKGGQFVLPDLKLVVEFPPNTLILVPSATLTHANIPVRKGESRVSFTQYCSGGLFRFVDNGFRTEKQLQREDPEEYGRIVELKKTHWQWGLSLYSRLEDIVSRVSSQ